MKKKKKNYIPHPACVQLFFFYITYFLLYFSKKKKNFAVLMLENLFRLNTLAIGQRPKAKKNKNIVVLQNYMNCGKFSVIKMIEKKEKL